MQIGSTPGRPLIGEVPARSCVLERLLRQNPLTRCPRLKQAASPRSDHAPNPQNTSEPAPRNGCYFARSSWVE